MSVCWPYLSNYTIVENNGLPAPRVEEGGYEKLIFNLLALFIIFGGTKFHDYKVVPNMGCHAELIKISQLFMCVCCMFAYIMDTYQFHLTACAVILKIVGQL